MADHDHITPASPSIVHMLTEQDFASRSAATRLSLVAREVSTRLSGMHDVLYGMALSHQAAGGKNYEHLTFLGSTVMDLSKALKRAHEDAWAEVRAADDAAMALKPRAKKRGA